MRRFGESKQHDQQKERIGQAAKEKGWNVEIDTKEFKIPGKEKPYIADVYGENFSAINYTIGGIHRQLLGDGGRLKGIPEYARGMRRFVIELQGFEGHNTRLAYQLDQIRIGQIREFYGSDIEYFEFYLRSNRSANDVRNYSKEDIQEHLKL